MYAPREAVRVCHGAGYTRPQTCPPRRGLRGSILSPGRPRQRRRTARRRNRAGACAALGRQPRRVDRIRAGSPAAGRGAVRDRRDAGAPRRRRDRRRVRLRPHGRALARRRPGPHVPSRDLRGHPRAPRHPRAAGAADRARHRPARPRGRQRQAVRARGGPRTHRHRRGDRDDRRRRGRAPERRRPERGGRRRGVRTGPLPAGRRGARVAGPRQRGDALPPGGRRVQHGGGVLRRDRGVLQPDLEQRLPAAARTRAREGDRAARTARTRTSAPRSTARRRTAAGRSRTRPRSRARRPRSTTCSTSTPRTGSRPTTPPRRS